MAAREVGSGMTRGRSPSGKKTRRHVGKDEKRRKAADSKRRKVDHEDELDRIIRREKLIPDPVTSASKDAGKYYLDEMIHSAKLLGGIDYSMNLPKDIPEDFDEFYKAAGSFTPPAAHIGSKPTRYQRDAWGDRKTSKYRLYLKSQKIGMSTYFLMEDLYVALTYGMGKEILVVAQKKEKAEDLLQALRKYIRNSPAYSDYLIESSHEGEDLLKNERSKADVLYLRNWKDPSRPTKIIALGIPSVGSLISFMNVAHIHMSDVTMANMSEENARQAFGGLFSRLANTQGTMVIECPPRAPSGPIWDIVNDAPELKKDGALVELTDEPVDIAVNGFRVRRLTYKMGIDAGLITERFIEIERRRLGPMFGMYYETDFYSSDKAFFGKELVNQENPHDDDDMAEINTYTENIINLEKQHTEDGDPAHTDMSDQKFSNPAAYQRLKIKEKKQEAQVANDTEALEQWEIEDRKLIQEIDGDDDDEYEYVYVDDESGKVIDESLVDKKTMTYDDGKPEKKKPMLDKFGIDRSYRKKPPKSERGEYGNW